jgi:virginiamycin B lyase
MKAKLYGGAAFVILGLAAAYAMTSSMGSDIAVAPGESLLSGKVTSTAGEALVGIPIKAHKRNSNITVSVYTNAQGEYSFPSWSDLTPASYDVAIELPDFEHVTRNGVDVSEGPTQVNFSLQPREPSVEDATASEVIAGLPGTDEQKLLFSQCSNCHSLQWALRITRTKEQWTEIITRMIGRRNAQAESFASRTIGQKRFIEPLADYLAQIRGPDTKTDIPFKLRPRPTDEASTKLVVTEYGVPRGGHHELYMIRGDSRFVWPHDVVLDDKYAYYTDHFSYVLGRVDRKTGEATETPFPLPQGAGRNEGGAMERAGNPGGGAHDILMDKTGKVLIGMDNGIVRFDPAVEKFQGWTSGSNMFGLDPNGNIWHTAEGGTGVLYNVNTTTGDVKTYTVPKNDGDYDVDTDSQGRTITNVWREGKVAVFDPKTESYNTYQLPTPESGPRRGQIDAQDRLWVAQYFAGSVAMFDPNKGESKEFTVVTGSKPFGAPYAAPYSTSFDNKNQWVWTNDFNSNRIFRIDATTGQSTEFFMPGPYEVRDLTVEEGTERPTLWLPVYRPPAKIVKVQVRND